MPKSVTFQSVKQKTRFDLPPSLSREIGRIVTRWAHYEHYIQAIIWGINLDRDLLKLMKPIAKSLNSKRNLVAHGVWTEIPSGWIVQETRETWEDLKDGPRGRKRVQPEAVPMTVADLRQIWAELENLIASAKTLKGKLGES